MAVTTSYEFGFVEALDPTAISSDADATSLANGGIVVTGTHAGHTDPTIFEADGDIIGSPDSTTGTSSAVCQLSNGNIVIVTATGGGILYKIIDGAGATVVGSTGIVASADTLNPDVAGGLAGGRFAIAYQTTTSPTDHEILVSVRNNDGSFAALIQVDTSNQDDLRPSVATLNDGGFAIAYHKEFGTGISHLWYAVYEGDGSVRKAPVLLDDLGSINRNASVVALADGGFAIVYEDSGWNSDIDLTFARFDAAGIFIDRHDVANTSTDETLPSTTTLSNGLVVIGSTDASFSDTDPKWTLVDPNTGNILAAGSNGFTFDNDTETSVAGMMLGQVAAFFTDPKLGDVVGQVLQARRFSDGDSADDTIVGDELVDLVNGGGGADSIDGGANGDVLHGDAGNDTLTGGAGGDRLVGGTDIDTANYAGSSGAVTVALDAGPGVGGDGAGDELSEIENLIGSNHGDTLTGNDGSNVLSGGLGSDTLLGLGGTDTLAGGAGVDSLNGGGARDRIQGTGAELAGDRVDGGLGVDQVYVRGGGAFDMNAFAQLTGVEGVALASATELTTSAVAGLRVYGSAGADEIVLANVGQNVAADAGADSVTGGSGADTIFGGAGADELRGGAGADFLNGGLDDDFYVVDAGDFASETDGGGVDTVESSVDYTLRTGFEHLQLTGGALQGFGNELNNEITGNALANFLKGRDGADRLDGGGNADLLYGGIGNDELLGGAGADDLRGEAGADTLRGGLDADKLQGGADADRFDFAVGDGGATIATADRIYDFVDGSDLIGLSGGLTSGQLTIQQGSNVIGGVGSANDAVISITATGAILVVVQNISTIDNADFVLIA